MTEADRQAMEAARIEWATCKAEDLELNPDARVIRDQIKHLGRAPWEAGFEAGMRYAQEKTSGLLSQCPRGLA